MDIFLAYAGTVLLKWLYEALDWISDNKGQGWRGWFQANWLDLSKKGVLHVPLMLAWSSGALTAAMNGVAHEAIAKLGPDPGIAVVPPQVVSAVTWQSSVCAAWMLDSFGKPWAKRIRRRAAAEEASA